MPNRSIFVAVLAAGCLAAGCGQPSDIQQGEYFALAVEQGGQRVPIRNNQAVISREPFAIVLAMPQLGSVLVNASPEPTSFNQARGGAAMDQIVGLAGQQVREDRFNPGRVLTIAEREFHNWFYMGPQNHRYDEIRQEQGVYLCRRSVEGYRAAGGGPPRDIRYYTGDAIYLVLISTDWAGDRSRRVETQRQYLTLRFK